MNNDSTKYAKKNYSNVTNQNVLCSKENFLTVPINFEDLTRTFSMKSGFNISVNA